MKTIILSIAGLLLTGFLSAQTTTTKTKAEIETNATEKSTSTTTTTTVTKSSPVLKKKLVVVNSSKINQASGIVKEEGKSKNIDKKEEENTEPK